MDRTSKTIPLTLPLEGRIAGVALLLIRGGFFTASHYNRKRLISEALTTYPELVCNLEVGEKERFDNFLLYFLGNTPENIEQATNVIEKKAKALRLDTLLFPQNTAEETFLPKVQSLSNNMTIPEEAWVNLLVNENIRVSEFSKYRELVEKNGYYIEESFDEIFVEEDLHKPLSRQEITSLFLDLKEVVGRYMEGYSEGSSEYKERLRGVWATPECRAIVQTIYQHNVKLVSMVIGKMNMVKSKNGEDEVQEGTMGLLHAIRLFDLSRGWHFSTYAVGCIRSYIKRYRNSIRYKWHVPEDKLIIFQKAVKTKNELEMKLGREITLKEWSEAIGLAHDWEKFRTVISINQEISSLNASYMSSPDSDDLILEEIVKSVDTSVEDLMLENNRADDIRKVLTCLTSREEMIIRMCYGLINSPEEIADASVRLGRIVQPSEIIKLEELAGCLNLTRERVRQIRDKARMKLRHPTLSKTLLVHVN